MPTFTAGAVANDHRRDVGADRQAVVFAAYFERGDTAGATGGMLAAGRARVAFPGDTLTELGGRLGVSKHTVAGRLRRLEKLASSLDRDVGQDVNRGQAA